MSVSDIDLRKAWDQLPSPDLEAMLQEELERKVPDDDKVLLLLHILEARESDEPLELTEHEREAFEQYKARMLARRKKPRHVPRWLSAVASLVLIVGLLVSIIPQQAEAETFWEMLQRWSDTVLEFFSGDGRKAGMPYSFETDNPGLQQVYDAVVEMGVTDPVVPMWLPEGYNLAELNSKATPMSQNLWAWFSDGENDIMYKLDIYDGEPAHQFYKDDVHYESYEKNGTIFNITKNLDEWIVVWTKDNIECFITLGCQEDTLRRILGSIFVMEE